MLVAGFSVRYISFVSQTIYQESTSHLQELLHKSNNMLSEMVRKNLTYLHLYNGFLESTSDEAGIQAYIEQAQQDTGFAGFYFLTYDGNYMTVTGETGYLGLQTNLDEKLADGDDIVMNTALPGKASDCWRSSVPKHRAATGALPTTPLPSLIIMTRCFDCWTALPLRAMPAAMWSTRMGGW